MNNFVSESLADLIAVRELQYTGSKIDDIKKYQKTISGGQIQIGRQSDADTLVLYKSDILAHQEEQALIENSNLALYHDTYTTTLSDYLENHVTSAEQMQSLVDLDILDNQPNISQFVNFSTSSRIIDPFKANEIFNREIFELKSPDLSRQERITNWFREYQSLKPPTTPDYINEVGQPISDDEDGIFYINDSTYNGWLFENDLSYRQDYYNSENVSGFITRITGSVDEDYFGENETNVQKSLQWIRDDISRYLRDVDESQGSGIIDTRPVYQDQSNGYIKIRGLNQGIIIKQESDGTGVPLNTLSPSVITNDEYKLRYLNRQNEWYDGLQLPVYLQDGFTITMWVRFLDKVNSGTLFNYGNPYRDILPSGFRLETFVIKKDEIQGYPSTLPGNVNIGSINTFGDDDYERFVRLVVREPEGLTRDSHVGFTHDISEDASGVHRFATTTPAGAPRIESFHGVDWNPQYLFYNTRVPVDFDEWYFVVASYDPNIKEDESFSYGDYETIPEFWRGNIDPLTGNYTVKSGYGSKCKVEIISKSDLLRARGYKPQ